jgi:hypothetical protein
MSNRIHNRNRKIFETITLDYCHGRVEKGGGLKTVIDQLNYQLSSANT